LVVNAVYGGLKGVLGVMAESVTSRDRIEKLLKEIGELKGPIERTLMDVRETLAAVMGVVGSLYGLLLNAISMVRQFLPLSPDLPLGLMWRVMAVAIVVMSLTCALLVYLIEGSSRARLALYFGSMLLVSSAVFYMTSTGATALLESLTSHLSRLRSMW
jgi:flagellar protein FlaJ